MAANGSAGRLGGRRNRDMVRLTVYLPRPVVAWLDGLAVGSGLTRSDELRLALASLATSTGPAGGDGVAVGADLGGGSSSAPDSGAPEVADGAAAGVPSADPVVGRETARSVSSVSSGGQLSPADGGVAEPAAGLGSRRAGSASAPSRPGPERVFSPAPGRPEVCGRADCGASKYRHASGRWCP